MTMLRSLAHRNFRLFFIGQGLSLIGTWMQTTALAWLVNRLTAPPGSSEGDPFWLGMIVFATQIPGLVLGPVSGVVTDRFRRRPILYVTQTLMMLQAVAMTALAYANVAPIWPYLVLGTVLGVVSTFDVTARQAFLTQMVGGDKESLANAIALNSSLFNGARLVGPALAGPAGGRRLGRDVLPAQRRELPGRAGRPVDDAAARGPSGRRHARLVHDGGRRPLHVRLAAHSRHPRAGGGRQPRRHALRLPAAALRRPQLARRRGDARPADGRGRRRGAGRRPVHGRRKTVLGLGRHIAASPVAFGAGLIVFAYSTTQFLSLPALAVMGFAMMVQMASSNTILQTIVDEDKRGRVMSFYATAFLGLSPIGALAVGALAKAFGALHAVAGGGVICILAAAVFAWQLPAIREHIRPIYRRIGILPEVAEGIQVASDPRTGAFAAVAPKD